MRIVKEDTGLMVLKEGDFVLIFVVAMLFIFGISTLFSDKFFDTNFPPLLAGLISIFVGLLILFKGEFTIIRLNKAENKISFLKKKIIGSKSITEYPIDQIKEVELSVEFYVSNEQKGYYEYLSFVFKDGKNIRMGESGESSNTVHHRLGITSDKGKRIASFLGVPFQERRPPTVQETLSTMSKTIKESITSGQRNNN